MASRGVVGDGVRLQLLCVHTAVPYMPQPAEKPPLGVWTNLKFNCKIYSTQLFPVELKTNLVASLHTLVHVLYTETQRDCHSSAMHGHADILQSLTRGGGK